MLHKRIGFLLVLALAVALPMAAQRPASERIIGQPKVEGVGDTWAVIAWTTNTGGSTVVRYGTDQSHLNERAQAPYADNDRTAAQNHRVHLTNLRPGTTYYFIVDSDQGEGTGTDARSSIGSFTTRREGERGEGERGEGGRGEGGRGERAAGVQIVNEPRVESTGADWAVVEWTTNVASGSVVRYGTDPNNLSQMAESPYADNDRRSAQNHRVRLTNLRPNTTYFFIVDSGHAEGTGTDTRSKVSQFRTK